MSETKRSGCKGCFLWFLCLSGFFLLLAGVGAYLGYRKFVSFRDQYTGAAPLSLPAVNFTPQELAATRARVDRFLDRSGAANTNQQLALSSRDLNLLIASSPFSNRVHVALSNDMVAGQFSIPLDQLGIRFLRGRYLNGAGSLGVSCENGYLKVNIQDLAVNGLALPENYLASIRRQNFAEGFATNTATQRALAKVQSLLVEGDRLVFQVGTNQPAR